MALAALAGFFGLLSPAQAQTPAAAPDLGLSQVGAQIGLPTTDIRLIVANVIRTALGLLGIIALIIVLYGGFVWMTAGGNEEKIATAKKILRDGAIGLLIILSAYAIVSFVISKFLAAGSGGVTAGGGNGGGGGTTGFVSGNVLAVAALPASGSACVRNVHLVVVFNKEVDLATFKAAAQVSGPNGPATGSWDFGNAKTTVVFTPQGDCGPDGGNDCLIANGSYGFSINNPANVRSFDGQYALDCTVGAGCGPVNFTAGSGVERTPPTVAIATPAASSTLSAGVTQPVQISFTDKSGLQNLSFSVGGALVSSKSFAGCQTSGTADFTWPTQGLATGDYVLSALGINYAGLTGADSHTVTIRPAHCFNGVQDADQGETGIDCGGECGACGGQTCGANSECASGFCQTPPGICIDKTSIQDVNPLSGAPGTWVSIAGRFFGDNPGKVYFSGVSKPGPSDWVQAAPIACGPGSNGWTDTQIIAAVPPGLVGAGPIRVDTGSIKGRDGVVRRFTDTTSGKIPDFQINNIVHPGVCAVLPNTGLTNDPIQIKGKNFGVVQTGPADGAFFGDITRAQLTSWSDRLINTRVPALEPGAVSVKVKVSGAMSNGVQFTLGSGENANDPVISSIIPDHGGPGQYLTITGKNFGTNQGQVWFKLNGQGSAVNGDFTFPAACNFSVWSDSQIIVKAPNAPPGTYSIQVYNNTQSNLPTPPFFTLTAGQPGPGICNFTPVSGVVPMNPGETIHIDGEFFGDSPDVYFWKNGASPSSTFGRIAADKTDHYASTPNSITVRAPSGAQTGPVVAYRGADQAISNPAQFTVSDCRQNNPANTCSTPGLQCCVSGTEAGSCKASADLCAGETRSAGYVWRFSTKDIPAVPHVVEQCNADTDVGKNIPTPSPSITWDTATVTDHINVCATALVTVQFTTPVDPATVDPAKGNIVINRCTTVKNGACVNPTPVPFTDRLQVADATAAASSQYVQLTPKTLPWEPDRWYQVVLTTGITSAPGPEGSVPLALDKPCEASGSAYCFLFKTDPGGRECRLSQVVVTPYSYWTSVLEKPIQFGQAPQRLPLVYQGNGLSDQHCIMMDMAGYSWKWDVDNRGGSYASIFKVLADPRQVNVSALANTVGVGLTSPPPDAVSIKATAVKDSITHTGASPLAIDLSAPKVVDYWPKCLAACTNAEVAVRFNTSLSDRNLPGLPANGTVQLLKCSDENCLSTTAVLNVADVFRDPSDGSNYTILKIANSQGGSTPLDPNSYYEVVVSASSSFPNNQVWSAAALASGVPIGNSKPYDQAFVWRFKTKNTVCQVGKAVVTPDLFTALSLHDRSPFSVNAFSSPDSCNAEGQKIDPWSVNWSWSAADKNVATVTTYSTAVPKNSACTASCVRKGADLPSTAPFLGVCGDGKLEAGEDCDAPDATKGCGLNCLYLPGYASSTCGDGKVGVDPVTGYGKICDTKDPATAIGCAADCRHAGAAANPTDPHASICGSGAIGSGKDCDTAISADVSNPQSSLGCSSICLHQGTKLSRKWCADHSKDLGGFTNDQYAAACKNSLSQCGDGVPSDDKDRGCDLGGGKHAAWCDDYCRIIDPAHGQCVSTKEGCGPDGRYLGSSLYYSAPSVCGDGTAGVGEDPVCETNLGNSHNGFNDPWALATGVGHGPVSGSPPSQNTLITAATPGAVGAPVSGSGKFAIACGYKTDADCAAAFGDPSYGVAANSCCYPRPKLLSAYPVADPPQSNVCPNTYISAQFDQPIDPASVSSSSVVLARAILDKANSCGANNDVTALMADALTPPNSRAPWYAQALNLLASWWRALTGDTADAIFVKISQWCAGADVYAAKVVTENGASRIEVALRAPLATSTRYAVILKDAISSTSSVSIGKAGGKPISWYFDTGSNLCAVDAITVAPKLVIFNRAGAVERLEAKARSGQVFIQSIPDVYSWDYLWGPLNNPSVSVEDSKSNLNLLTGENHNGETDIHVGAVITKDASAAGQTGAPVPGDRAHAIVFLCENPWPPQSLYVNNGASVAGPFNVFPYQDTFGNHDNFSAATGYFDNQTIPPSLNAATGKPIGDGYFNFSSFYCADAPDQNSGLLPFLHPAVQVGSDIQYSNSGACEFTGKVCSPGNDEFFNGVWKDNTDCGTKLTAGNYNFTVPTGSHGVCGGVGTGTPPDNHYFANTDGTAIGCSTAADCTGDPGFSAWNSRGGFTASCFINVSAVNLRCFITQPFKRFIFTNDQNKDAIGLQVFANGQHLTPQEWYENDKKSGGQGFRGAGQNVSVDGYAAISDDNNLYVDALNASQPTSLPQLYSNIYLLSINADAAPATRLVYNQLKNNLRFNINLSNYGYCGRTLDAPDFSSPCRSDLDCTGGRVCSVQSDKLKRDYQRLRDLRTMDAALNTYAESNSSTFPAMAKGSYLSGQALSVWPGAWAALGSQIGAPLPVDPVNRLGLAGTCGTSTDKLVSVNGAPARPLTSFFCTGNNPATDIICPPVNGAPAVCVLHDPDTGWSTADRRFSFACASSSYAYRYIQDPAIGFKLRSHLEPIGLDFANWDGAGSFLNGFGFSDAARITLPNLGQNASNFCAQDQEVSTINPGACGDGIVHPNLGEECNPPGQVQYGSCVNGTVAVQTCDAPGQASASDPTGAGCQWVKGDPIACSDVPHSVYRCGSGVLTPGDGKKCDDGRQNGSYNHCNTSCTGLVAPYDPANPSASPGYCGDDVVSPKYEVCDPFKKPSGGQSLWGPTKAQSCNWDCQTWGPYCGDGIIDPPHEDCDGDTACTVGGQSGRRYCASICRADGGRDKGLAGYWNFDSRKLNGNTLIYPDGASAGLNSASCTWGTDCPADVGGRTATDQDSALSFNGSQGLNAGNDPSLMPPKAVTVEAWLNPANSTSPIWQHIVEKGGFTIGGGYSLQFENDTGKIDFVVWQDGANNHWRIISSNPLPVNTWTHVVGTYQMNTDQSQTIRLYINGAEDTGAAPLIHQVDGTNTPTSNTSVNQPPLYTGNDAPLNIGQAAAPGVPGFSGLIDDLKVYNRALTAAEVKDHFANIVPCTPDVLPGAAPIATAGNDCPPGDGHVDPGEACDNGAANGKACTPTYGKSCSYCSADCKNVVTVSPKQYCGDGIIEANKVCDTAAGAVYSAISIPNLTDKPTAAYNGYRVYTCAEQSALSAAAGTLLKGAVQCVNNCSAIAVKETGTNSCVLCGLNPNGSQAGGSIINVIDPNNPPFQNTAHKNIDLYTGATFADASKRVAGAWNITGFNYLLNTSQNAAAPDPNKPATQALIGDNTACSFGDQPNYAMILDTTAAGPDLGRAFSFPVYPSAAPWQYDLLLSPVIDQSARPGQIRIVVSWVGDSDFWGGFVMPPSVVGGQKLLYDPSNWTPGFAVGNNYDQVPKYPSDQVNGVWYHGFAQTAGQTKVEGYTIDTAGADMGARQFAFYVRSADPIAGHQSSSRLRVDIYTASADADAANHFDKTPAKSYFLAAAAASDNPAAPYWYVFDVASQSLSQQVAPLNRLTDENKIITDFNILSP